MKIIQLIDIYDKGGAEKVYDALTQYLLDRKIDCHRCVLYKSNTTDIRFLLTKKENSFFGKAIKQLVAIIRMIRIISVVKPTRIISFLDRSNVVAIIAASFYKIPVTVTVHNPLTIQYQKIQSSRKWLVYLVLRILYNKKNIKVIAVSETVGFSLKKIGVRNAIVVYNPLQFRNVDEYQVLESDFFLSIGRFEYQKAYWKIIKAFYLLKKRNATQKKLIMIGDGPMLDDVKLLVAKLGLVDEVKLLGYIKNPIPYLAKAYAIVFSSYFEGFPITLLEAFSLRKPFIATYESVPYEIKVLLSDMSYLFYSNQNKSVNFTTTIETDDIEIMKCMITIIEDKDIEHEIAKRCNSWFNINISMNNFDNYFGVSRY